MKINLLPITLAAAALAVIALTHGCALQPATVDSASPSAVAPPRQIHVAPDCLVVQAGSNATFSVIQKPRWSYQWLVNGFIMPGQTNSSLTLQNVQPADAGNYSCRVANGPQTWTSDTAILQVFVIITPDPTFVVYSTPTFTGGSTGSCPGSYVGYVYYCKSTTNGWGWAPYSGTNVYTATDTNCSNSKVAYRGEYSDNGCAKTTVAIPSPTTSPAYQFYIYFTNNVPTTNYPILLSGFNP